MNYKKTALTKRVRQALLYTMAAALVGYFGVNAYTGKYGLNARAELDQEIVTLTAERERLIPAHSADLFVGNSGTTMRFLTALLGLGQGRYRLDAAVAADDKLTKAQAKSIIDGVFKSLTEAERDLVGLCRDCS